MKQGLGKDGIQQVAVLGAAGKMGSGIALLILQQFAADIAKNEKDSLYRLVLIDSNEKGFVALRRYLRDQLKKYAERNINELRRLYSDRLHLIDNGDMIHTYLDEAMDSLTFSTHLEECQGVQLVFEAIIEDIPIKTDVFSKLNKLLGSDCYYFTNTSSIPIQVLQEKSHLTDRLIGFHFYNPPAVQKLLELIIPKNTPEVLRTLAENIAKQLKKTIVYSNDLAGFIGNGHFIREVQFACQRVHKLSKKMPLVQAIIIVNRITQEFLLRPMGIFQLVDYVGIEVVQRIAKIMSLYLHKNFGDELIDKMVLEKVWGGQFGDGSQKDGFFHYEKGVPIDVYEVNERKYVSCNSKDFEALIDAWLGGNPPLGCSWGVLVKDPQRSEKINCYFKDLAKQNKEGSQLAEQFLEESKRISSELVTDGVAVSIDDVQTVLKNGFLHLY